MDVVRGPVTSYVEKERGREIEKRRERGREGEGDGGKENERGREGGREGENSLASHRVAGK